MLSALDQISILSLPQNECKDPEEFPIQDQLIQGIMGALLCTRAVSKILYSNNLLIKVPFDASSHNVKNICSQKEFTDFLKGKNPRHQPWAT